MNNNSDLKNKLEALLFVSGKPLKAKDFSKILEVGAELVETALTELLEQKKENGVILLENNGEYQLSTNSKYSPEVKNFLNAELREKLTDATVEVLAIIAYRQPISKAEIEAIRGVNSQYSVRNLLMRGLIEKISNPNDARSSMYQTTTEFLMHLGLTSTKDLPDFEKLTENIKLPQTPGLNPEIQTQQPTTAEPIIVAEQIEKQPPIVEQQPDAHEKQIILPTEEKEEEFEDDADSDDEDEE